MDWFPELGFVMRIYDPQPSIDMIRSVEKQEMKHYVYYEGNMMVSIFSFGLPANYYYCRFDPSISGTSSESLFSVSDLMVCVVNSKNNLVFGLRKPVKLSDTYIEMLRRMHASARTNENYSFQYLTWTGMTESRSRLDDLTLKGKLLMTYRY